MTSMPDPILLLMLLAFLALSAALRWSAQDVRSDDGPRARERIYRLHDGRMIAGAETRRIEGFKADLVEDQARSLGAALMRLEEEGSGFDMLCTCRDGRHLDLSGFVSGASVYVSVIDVTRREEAAAMRHATAATEAAQAAIQSDLLDHAPYLQWRMSGDGDVLWSNAHALQRRGLHPAVVDLLVARVSKLDIGDGVEQRRISVQPPDAPQPQWFDVTLAARPDGAMLGFALEADRIMRAEAALGRFVETLTETFAHLPIGLAIFDRDRELGLFNPALADLLRLDPAWLAGRPTLASFLNHLRERRALPDQRDFRRWREQLITLGRDGGTQDFTEVWVQPSGRTLRVVGRPHPQGAVAFMLEDITPAVTLEQQFREGMTLRAAALDAQPGTHLIFDLSGAATFVGEAFGTMTGGGLEADALRAAGGIHEVLRRCRATFGEAAVWDRVLGCVVGHASARRREPLVVPLRRKGETIAVLELRPLPGGGSLLSFLPPPRAGAERVLTLRTAVEQALEQGRSVTEPADLSVRIEDAGAGGVPCARQDLIRRVGYTMLLAAADAVPAGGELVLSVATAGEDVLLGLSGGGADLATVDVAGTLPVSLLRRYLGEVGGMVEVGEGPGFAITLRLAQAALQGVGEAAAPPALAGARQV